MSSSKKELEEQLKQAGHSLLKPPSNTDDLLKLLDEVEGLLSAVKQEPPTSLQDALLPAMTAIISDVLLRHSDTDVKVSVASCITEITRITAPDAPYDDDRMKEIFKLIVAAFENLSHLSGRSYKKAVSTLKVVAKVSSSVMMLDLGCYTLIAEMFQLFLDIIQCNHPLAVFSDMQTIMTMVLDESEEIPLELLKILLISVRKENQKLSPFSWKLGKTVLDNCADKLKPYLMEAVKSLGAALDDYARIVASICQQGSDTLKLDHVVKNQVTEVVTANAACPTSLDKSVAAPTSDEPTVVHDSSTTLQRCHLTKHSKVVDLQYGAGPENSLSVKAGKSVTEPDSGIKKKSSRPHYSMDPEEKSVIEPHSSPKKRGRKPNSLMNPEEGYENHWMQSGQKSPKSAGNRKSHEKGSDSLPTEDRLSVKVTTSSLLPSTLQEVTEPSGFPLTLKKTTESPTAQPKAEVDIGSASSLLQNGHPDGTESRRGRPKKQVVVALQKANPTLAKGDFSSAQAEERSPRPIDTLKMEPKETSTVKAKSRGRPRKYPVKTNDETIIASALVGTGKESAVPYTPDENQQESALTLGTGNIIHQSTVQKIGTGNVSATRPRGRPRKLPAKLNQETVLTSERVVVTEDSPVLSGPEQKPEQEPALQSGTGSIMDQSGLEVFKKRRLDDAPSIYRLNWFVKDQNQDVKASLEESLEDEYNDQDGFPELKELHGTISIHALDLISQQTVLAHKIDDDSGENCSCAIRGTHGLPCAHDIANYMRENQPIPPECINPHWRTLELKPLRKAGGTNENESAKRRRLSEEMDSDTHSALDLPDIVESERNSPNAGPSIVPSTQERQPDDEMESVLFKIEEMLESLLPGMTHGNKGCAAANLAEAPSSTTPTHAPSPNSCMMLKSAN